VRACMVAYSCFHSDNRVRRYAETLVKHGYQVDAISLRGADEPETQNIHGVRVFNVQRRVINEKNKLAYLCKMLLFLLRSLLLLTRNHFRERYDIIHVHSLPDFEVFAAIFAKLAGAKVILDIHDIVPEFYASKFNVSHKSLVFKLLVAVERMSAGFADHVIAANHIWHKRLQQRSVKGSKLTTLLNFPDTRLFHRRGKSRNDGKLILLYPGSLNYHQGLDIAIRAFALVKDEVPEAEFHIYGWGGEILALRALIAELGLQDRVFLKGSVPLDQMAAVIENGDLGIVPKRKSGFGNEAFSTKILEFMSMGVPVVIPDTAVDTYYFDDSVAKFFRAGDEKSLAESMLPLMKDREARERLSENATRFVKQYLWSENESAYLGIIDSLLNSTKTQATRKPEPLF
jgi:glycosyltransferase involved in cell wall biosynthesis